jgi:osmotically-inducible protein OsmY
MKIVYASASLLLIAAGCSSYPEKQYSSTYSSTPSYTYTPSPSIASTPTYRSSTVTPPGVPTTYVFTDADRALSASVRRALNESANVAGISRNIYIDSRNGMVTLTGAVPTEQDRQFIKNAVRNTTGVYNINDQIQVVAPAVTTVPTVTVPAVTTTPTGATETRVYASTPEVLVNPSSAGTIFNLHVQGLDEPDRSMAQRILQELRADTILPSLLPMVNITVAGGVATLEGNVQNERQRQAIDTAVRRATGGRVDNRLLVR